MKTLNQLEPRTPIGSLPFTVGKSGSYYLTGNLQFTAKTGDAIAVSASDVTIDLAGFTISSNPAVTGNAIHITSSSGRVTVQNGGITGNTTVTVSGNAPNQSWSVNPAGFAKGILAEGSSTFQFSQLRISGCRSAGIESTAGPANVREVLVTQNGLSGISVNLLGVAGNVSSCTAFKNGDAGIDIRGGTIANCSAIQNGGFGITSSPGSIVNSSGASNNLDGLNAFNGSISNCTAFGNDASGISGGNSSVTNSVASFNGNNGIAMSFGVVAFCTANQNNTKNIGGLDISAANSTRTGNNPGP